MKVIGLPSRNMYLDPQVRSHQLHSFLIPSKTPAITCPGKARSSQLSTKPSPDCLHQKPMWSALPETGNGLSICAVVINARQTTSLLSLVVQHELNWRALNIHLLRKAPQWMRTAPHRSEKEGISTLHDSSLQMKIAPWLFKHLN